MVVYDKLVRDKIPDIIRSEGKRLKVRKASDAEFFVKLREKLVEESKEFFESPSVEEFSDVLEVVDAIAKVKFNDEEVSVARAQKAAEKGVFDQRFILESVDE